jgi:hypothetical protein
LPALLLASCGDGGEKNGIATGTPPATAAGPWSGEVERPEGFPEDFPIYDNAVVTAANRFGAGAGDIFAIGMETADDPTVVRSFYEQRLAEPPWQVTNAVDIPEEKTVIVEFARQGDPRTGTVAIQQEQTNGRRTLITVSLPAPPGSVTPAPTTSPAP